MREGIAWHSALIAFTDLQRRVLEILAGEEASVSTASLLARLDVSQEELLLAMDPLAKPGHVVAVVTSLAGGWEITPRGRDAFRQVRDTPAPAFGNVTREALGELASPSCTS